MTRRVIVPLIFLVLVGACTFDTSGVAMGTAPPKLDLGVDLPDAASDLPITPDLPPPDLPLPDIPEIDGPVADLPLDDLPPPDLPLQDLSPPDLPVPDIPIIDAAKTDLPGPDQWVDPPDLWPAMDKPLPDMAPDQGFILPDFWPAADSMPWPDLVSPYDTAPSKDLVPWAPDLYPLPSCAKLFGSAKGYKICSEGVKTCRFYHDEGSGSGKTCNTLCGTHKCLGAWDTYGWDKCGTSNGANCTKSFKTATCNCGKW